LVPGSDALSPAEARLLGAREALWPQLQALDGLEGGAPYFSAPDALYLAAMRAAPEETAAILGARVQVLGRGQAGAADLPESDSGYRLRLLDPLPRAFLVHRTLRAADAAQLRTLSLREEALVRAPVQPGGQGAATAARLERPSSDSLQVELTAPAPGLLVIGEHFDPGWTASVDGAAAPVLEADLVAMGVPVPAGPHRVLLRYSPKGFHAGLALAAAAAVLLLALRGRRIA
jgi:hypothetical protein